MWSGEAGFLFYFYVVGAFTAMLKNLKKSTTLHVTKQEPRKRFWLNYIGTRTAGKKIQD